MINGLTQVFTTDFSSVQRQARASMKVHQAIRDMEVKRDQIREGISANLEEALEKLQRTANIFNTKLSFAVRKDLNRVIVKVVDSETNQVIRQIPPDEVLHMIEEIRKVVGTFVDRTL